MSYLMRFRETKVRVIDKKEGMMMGDCQINPLGVFLFILG